MLQHGAASCAMSRRFGRTPRRRVQGKLDNSKTAAQLLGESSERAHSRPHSAVVHLRPVIGQHSPSCDGEPLHGCHIALTWPAHLVTATAIDALDAFNSPWMRSPFDCVA